MVDKATESEPVLCAGDDTTLAKGRPGEIPTNQQTAGMEPNA